MFATNRKSVSYKAVLEKVPNRTSKGRKLDFKRAPLASQLGVFLKPKEHVLFLNCTKIVYKCRYLWERVKEKPHCIVHSERLQWSIF